MAAAANPGFVVLSVFFVGCDFNDYLCLCHAYSNAAFLFGLLQFLFSFASKPVAAEPRGAHALPASPASALTDPAVLLATLSCGKHALLPSARHCPKCQCLWLLEEEEAHRA